MAVRYADDALIAFENVVDAERLLSVLGKRLARYGLTLHPDKTRLVDFRPKRLQGARHPQADGTAFDFLGLTHVWGRSRNGKDTVRTQHGRPVILIRVFKHQGKHREPRSVIVYEGADQPFKIRRLLREHIEWRRSQGATDRDDRFAWPDVRIRPSATCRIPCCPRRTRKAQIACCTTRGDGARAGASKGIR